ncbi:phosphohydrolase [Pseudomonas mandelii]|uniref:HD domain-containing protein n=1 Tax=Pseudomonas TaxID=286 RepID=UPI000B97635F|nr:MULTISPECIES: HD domain-containing protein [Pseudomonas]OYQ22940.1 phosphohydrolase [Pseudomonas mandelii]
MTTDAFAPLQTLAAELLPHALEPSEDGAHDLSHLQRVWHNVRTLHAEEGGDLDVLLAAVLLHDCVAVEKNSPLRSQASRLAAEKASVVLANMNWPSTKIKAVAHAIEAHSFSANITPTSLEAKIMQDADRLDSLGMLGVARTFYIAGRMGSALYDPQDPEARARDYDDKRFCLDHFQTKLLHLADGFQTMTGQRLARVRHERLKGFMDLFKEEIGIPRAHYSGPH